MVSFKNNDRSSEILKISLIRWWAAGSVYFMIGMGMASLDYSSYIDVLVFLSLGLIFANNVIVNTIERLAFNTESEDELENKSKDNKTKKIIYNVLSTFIIVTLIMYTYTLINTIIISMFNLSADSVPIPTEPILFGLLYAVYYLIFNIVYKKIKNIVSR